MVSEYTPPSALNIVFEFDDDIYVAPSPLNVVFVFDQESQAEAAYVQGIGITGFSSGQHSIFNATESIAPFGFYSTSMGVAEIRRASDFVNLEGILATSFGQTNLKNKNQQILNSSFSASLYGRPLIYNVRQYVLSRQFDSAIYGEAYVQGGVKYVSVRGFDAASFGKAKAHKNEQYIDLHSPSRGIAPPIIDRPNVSPSILYPKGILPAGFGNALVQRNPSPKGFLNDRYGDAWVSHSPRHLNPGKVDAFQSGYPKIFDPTQRIYHEGSPHIPGGIFGDIAAKNSRRMVSVLGVDQSLYGDWSIVASNLSMVGVLSFDSNAFGTLDIWNKTPSIIPQPFDSATFGTTFISERVRRILGRGIDMLESQRFGKHTLTKPPELFPRTFLSQEFGQTTISNRRRFIFAGALDSLVFKSDITVWFRYRHLNPVGIKEIEPGKPKIEHGLRTLLQKGSDLSRVATPTIWFKVRSVLAPSIYREFETRHTVGGTQFIKPDGYVASLFGTRIVPENQGLYGTGFNAQGFTEKHKIELHTRWARATGFLSFGIQTSDRYGTAKIWNKRQYIRHSYDSGDGLNPGGFGQWTAIANRNREMKVSGFDAARYGYQQIDNKARPLFPPAFTPTVFGTAMIADRIRHVRLEGMEAPYMSGWGRIFNTAHQMLLSGSKHDRYGQPTVINTRREYRWVGAFESMLFGQLMVAFRIRRLSIESRYSIAPVYLPIPKVELHTRYIDPQGHDLQAFGGPSLYIKWNIITTRWSHRELLGEPGVRNVTPELKQRGINTEDFGKPSARLQWEKYAIDGFGNQIFGRLNIAYRNRSMTVAGFNAFAIGQVKVTKTGAPPYSLQNITLDWAGEGVRPEYFNGQGINPPIGQVSNPSLKTNVIFASGFIATVFGSQHTQSNGILVYPGIQDFKVGDHTVSLRNRMINVPSMGDLSQIDGTRPRLSPYTIAHSSSNQSSSRFGSARIGLKNRKLSVSAGNELIIGNHDVMLKKRYIMVKGFLSLKNGWHDLSDGSPRELQQFDSMNQAEFGLLKVESLYYGPQTIQPKSMNATVFGLGRIDLFHRTIRANGFNAVLMGGQKSGDTPYKPQGLWIGPQMPTIPNGFISERFGSTWISNKVRDVSVVGFDSLNNDWDIESFGQRLKVILVKKQAIIEAKEVKPLSFGHTTYGVPDIRLKTHYIRPDGNSDQYRKGGSK